MTHVVSLGSACRVAHNLRRFFNFRTAYPFDWWVTSSEGLIALLDDFDVGRLYDPLRLHLDWHNTSVRNSDFGVWLHHEFPRDWQAAGQPVVENFRDLVETPRRRTEHLYTRFRALDRAGERILFVRETPHEDRWRTNDASVSRLATALQERFRIAEFGLLVVNAGADRGPSWVCHAEVADGPVNEWRGDVTAWQNALQVLGARLAPGLHAPPASPDLDAHSAASRFDAYDPSTESRGNEDGRLR